MSDSRGHYRCTKCQQWKPPEEFYVNKRARSGLMSWCKFCLGKRTEEEQAEIKRQRELAYQKEHKEEMERVDRRLWNSFWEMLDRRMPYHEGTVKKSQIPHDLLTELELQTYKNDR